MQFADLITTAFREVFGHKVTRRDHATVTEWIIEAAVATPADAPTILTDVNAMIDIMTAPHADKTELDIVKDVVRPNRHTSAIKAAHDAATMVRDVLHVEADTDSVLNRYVNAMLAVEPGLRAEIAEEFCHPTTRGFIALCHQVVGTETMEESKRLDGARFWDYA